MFDIQFLDDFASKKTTGRTSTATGSLSTVSGSLSILSGLGGEFPPPGHFRRNSLYLAILISRVIQA